MNVHLYEMLQSLSEPLWTTGFWALHVQVQFCVTLENPLEHSSWQQVVKLSPPLLIKRSNQCAEKDLLVLLALWGNAADVSRRACFSRLSPNCTFQKDPPRLTNMSLSYLYRAKLRLTAITYWSRNHCLLQNQKINYTAFKKKRSLKSCTWGGFFQDGEEKNKAFP